jgi:hypothetical protein
MPTTTKALSPETKTATTKKKSSTSTPIVELPPNPFLFEILDLASKQKSNVKKVEVLQKYSHPALKSIFIWNFDETVISMLPEGDVPFFGDNTVKTTTISERIEEAVKQLSGNSIGAIDQKYSTLRREYDKLHNFVKGGNDTLNSVRRENIFINLLEGLHPLEAEILCLCKDKKLQTKYKITKEIISEAYPDIQWGGRS